jgi:hypothetical protein
MTLRFPSTDVAAGGVITPAMAAWNAATGLAGGTALAAGDKVRLDRNVIFDLVGANLGDSGPMSPRTAPTVAATGGGAAGGLLAAGTYRVAFAWVDTAGKESVESLFSGSFTVAAGNIPRVTIPAPPHPQIASCRLYVTNTAGSLTTLTKYSATDFAVALGSTSTVDMSAAALGTGVLPENGAVRLVHTSSRVKATGAWTLKGDLGDARTSGSGKTWSVDINDDNCDGLFDAAASAGKYENLYGLLFGLTGVRGGIRVTGTVRGDVYTNATRPRITASGEGTWRYRMFVSAAPSGDFSITDAEITSCADVVVSKGTAVGALSTPPKITAIATSGGTAGTGTLPRGTNNEQYKIAYSYATVDGGESVLSPWSDLFRPSASGAIPRATLPEAIPAGVSHVHVYIIDIRSHKVSDPHPRWKAFIPVTAGTTPVIDLNASLGHTASGMSMGVWTGGEESTVQRTRLRRCGTFGSTGNYASTSLLHDDFNWYRECLDNPVRWLNTAVVTTKTMVGSFYDTLLVPVLDNVGGLSVGTATDPVFLANFTPLMSSTTNKIDDGSRAYCRMTKQWGSGYPGSMNRWRVFVDASREWLAANRAASVPALGIQNWHGFGVPAGILTQQWYKNIIDSAGTDGVGDFFTTLGITPTGVTNWATTGNFMGADVLYQFRRVGDVFQENASDPATQRTKLYWTKNTGFLGTSGEPQMGHVNETNAFAGMVQDFSYNLGYAPDLPAHAFLLADFHNGGTYLTIPVVAHADFNAGFGLTVGTATQNNDPTTYAAQRGYDARDELFADAAGLDMRGGLGPLRADPGFRAFYRHDVTFMWREKGYAVGSARPSAAVVSDGTAKNNALLPEDIQEFYDWLVTVWWARPYVDAVGTSYTNVMDAIEAYRQWGTSPTNPLYAPELNGGDTPGWAPYVSLVSAAAVVYRLRRRLND